MGACAHKEGRNMNLWYVLYCKVQDVDKITQRVNNLSVGVFCPRYVRVSHRTDCHSVRIDEKVLFPNYLFLSFDINKIHTSTISSIPGAVGFVRYGSDVCTVPQSVISAIEYARLIALNDDDIPSDMRKCRNVSPTLLLKIQEISRLRSTEQRQVAFSHLLQSDF
jgi:transcriptional antiterminator RfaH